MRCTQATREELAPLEDQLNTLINAAEDNADIRFLKAYWLPDALAPLVTDRIFRLDGRASPTW